MSLWAGILIGLGCLIVGFTGGVRYCASNRVLPGVLARMSSERLNDVAALAGQVRAQLNARKPRRS